MSDMAEVFNEWRAMKAEKRCANRHASAGILSKSGIVFETKNDGAHLVVLAGHCVVDFWPGTGLWIVRGGTKRRRGVRKLVHFVANQRSET
jgi:hypothetical protein